MILADSFTQAVGYGEYNGVPVKIVYLNYQFDGRNNLFIDMTWSEV